MLSEERYGSPARPHDPSDNGRFHPHIIGIGGTLRPGSTSLAALKRALLAAQIAGATTELLDLQELNLPMFDPTRGRFAYEESVQQFLQAADRADGMIWSTAGYHGTLAGVTKNALDFLEFVEGGAGPYLEGRAVGLIATAGGQAAAVQAIEAMIQVVHSLRGIVVPLSAPVPHAHRSIGSGGEEIDPKWAARLEKLGARTADLVRQLRGAPEASR